MGHQNGGRPGRETERVNGVVGHGAGLFAAADATLIAAEPAPHGRKLENVQKSPLSVTGERLNTFTMPVPTFTSTSATIAQ